eukprot:6676248-Pyramimonas_sp.AAC.1
MPAAYWSRCNLSIEINRQTTGAGNRLAKLRAIVRPTRVTINVQITHVRNECENMLGSSGTHLGIKQRAYIY